MAFQYNGKKFNWKFPLYGHAFHKAINSQDNMPTHEVIY
jgi:hypothetical protein